MQIHSPVATIHISAMPPRKRTVTARASRRRGAKPRLSRSAATSSQTTESRTAAATSGLAPGMQAVNTYLAVANVSASMEFLERAFAFTRGVVLRRHRRPGAVCRDASRRLRDHAGSPRRSSDGKRRSAALYTYVTDVDRAAAEARKAGAGVTDAEDQPWGDRTSVITDPDGYRWVLATFKKLAPFT